MRLSLFYNLDQLAGSGEPEDESLSALYSAVEEQIIQGDQLGFATAWVAEHHFALYGRLPAPLLFLARLSALTDRIGLGTAVVEAVHYNPLRLAEDAALLDALSGGRLHLGIGSGGRNKPSEFAAFNIPMEEKSARTREIVALLQRAFLTGRLAPVGPYYDFPEVALDPLPVQTPQEMLYVAASASTPEWVGESGLRLLVPRVGDWREHLRGIHRFRESCSRYGPAPGYVAMLRFVFVAESEQAAQELTRRAFARYARFDCDIEWDGRTDTEEYLALQERMNMVIGTPEQVTARLREWEQQFGCDELLCQVYAAGVRHSDALRSMELLAAAVMPAVSKSIAGKEA